MMRDVRFRAIWKKHHDEWIYGAPYHDGGDWMMKEFHSKEIIEKRNLNKHTAWAERLIIPETIGQYAGLKDKNGKEMYESDVTLGVSSMQKEKGLVIFDNGAFVFKIISSRTAEEGDKYFLSTCKELEVIGNIHENPEMLEGNNS